MSDLESIKRKIRALKAIAQENHCAKTQGEVIAALNLANKLCQEHNLNLAEIEDEREIEVELKIDHTVRPLRDYKIKMAISMDNKICKMFDCELIYNRYLMDQKIIGTESDRELANYCIDFAHNSMESCWKAYTKTEEYKRLRQGFRSKILKKDYMTGYCEGVIEKIYEMMRDNEDIKIKSTGTSLMVIKKASIEKYTKANFDFGKARKHTIKIYSTKSLETGKQRGREIEFTKSIRTNKQEGTKLIGC